MLRRTGVVAWIVYITAGLQIVALLSFIAQYAFGPGTANTSGGAEMALFFFNLAPLALILAGLALFHFARWRVWRALAAFMVAFPPLSLAAFWLSEN